MRVTISSSSNDSIDDIYKKESYKLIEYLAQKGCDLNWGSGSISIMGLCYDGFSKFNRNIYGYTTKKYQDDIDNLPNAKHTVYDDTFDLKKYIYNDADLIICLPGGTGTVSEFFAYLEESRSNDNPKDIILYNVNHQFDSTIKLIDYLVENKFNSSSIYNYFKVINNLEEFDEYFNAKKRV
ncbi:MAG: LOG family protein [Bacilli bacterium]|nr:LOG family protein [Bacilli bacterium]